MIADVAIHTGWSFKRVGALTLPQFRVILGAINRKRKEQIQMWGGSSEDEQKPEPTKKQEIDAGTLLEQRVAFMKAKTGKTSFDLREVL